MKKHFWRLGSALSLSLNPERRTFKKCRRIFTFFVIGSKHLSGLKLALLLHRCLPEWKESLPLFTCLARQTKGKKSQKGQIFS